MQYWMMLVAAITWPLYLAVSAMLWLVGWPVCAYLAYQQRYTMRSSSRWPDRVLLQWSPRWAYLYGNEEDGINGTRGYATWADDTLQMQWWLTKTYGWSEFKRILIWSAWRNPTNNARFIQPFGFVIDPQRVRSIGNSQDPRVEAKANPDKLLWFFAWHGMYSGAWITWKGYRIRIGWNLLPKDSRGLPHDDYRRMGCGFKLQFQGDN